MTKYDFGGYVTKNDLKCTDGRVIRHGAFKECDGKRVPLVYQHQHRGIDNVLGFVDLENRDDGVYGYGSFNETTQGRNAKAMVEHGDLTMMSIYANQLKEHAKEVYHGVIREVSLVLSGANPGAVIDNLNFVHSDETFEIIEDEANIRSGIAISTSLEAVTPPGELAHADDDESDDSGNSDLQNQNNSDDGGERSVQDVLDGMSKEKEQALKILVGLAKQQADGADISDIVKDDDEVAHAEGSTLGEVFDTFTEEEKKVAYALIAEAANGAGDDDDDESGEEDDDDDSVAQSDTDEGATMAHSNVFEQDAMKESGVTYLSHADMAAIFKDAKARGSLRDAFNEFAEANDYDPSSLQHGIQNIEVFFPEVQAISNQPAIISRRMEWVAGVLAAVHKTPFSKVKSTAANLTAEEARAKGYIKGHKKVEEQISALKRTTGPTTVYKLQKLDRDDVIDIVDFDAVVWLKAEMRMMLDEEIARAYLIGDGRLASSNDKIDESCIRPIWTDDEVYSIHVKVKNDADKTQLAKNFIDAAIRSHRYYKGSGSPTLYVGPDMLTEMRLIRDEIGHRLYKNDQELADELRVSKIVEIEVFDDQTRDVDGTTLTLGGIIVNLGDYNVGATRGGEVTLFDDFDLNYNKLEYLIETRQSGALVQPASALVLEYDASATSNDDSDDPQNS